MARSSLLLWRNLRVDAVDVHALLLSDVARSYVPEQTEQDGAADPVDDVLLRLQPEERVMEERPVEEHRREDRADARDHGQRNPGDFLGGDRRLVQRLPPVGESD